MTAVPALTAVTLPVLSTVATPVSELSHVTLWSVASLGVTVAVKVAVSPTVSDLLAKSSDTPVTVTVVGADVLTVTVQVAVLLPSCGRGNDRCSGAYRRNLAGTVNRGDTGVRTVPCHILVCRVRSELLSLPRLPYRLPSAILPRSPVILPLHSTCRCRRADRHSTGCRVTAICCGHGNDSCSGAYRRNLAGTVNRRDTGVRTAPCHTLVCRVAGVIVAVKVAVSPTVERLAAKSSDTPVTLTVVVPTLTVTVQVAV